MSSLTKLELPADASSLMLVRQALEGLLSGDGFSPTQIHDVKLAVTEACSNVVNHAYGDGKAGRILIEMESAPGQLDVTISDEGEWAMADVTVEAGLGGMGIHLMRGVADRCEIVSSTDGTSVRLSFLAKDDGR